MLSAPFSGRTVGLTVFTLYIAYATTTVNEIRCFGQDAEQSPGQLLEEQQLVQMSLLLKGPPGGTILICHFKRTRKHCNGEGGGLQTIKNDPATIARHVSHGDCSSPVDACPNHCKCGDVKEGTIERP